MTAPSPDHLYCFVHGWTLSHGWSKGKWQGKHCRTLHAPSTPYTQAQLNAQDPKTGGNANIYVVRPPLPLACSPCLPSRVPPPGHAFSLISSFPSSGQRRGKSSPPPFLPSFVFPPTPTQWSPRGNRADDPSLKKALPFSHDSSPGLPTHLTPPPSLACFSPNLPPQPPTSASSQPPAQMMPLGRTGMPHPSHAGSHAESDGQAPFSPLSPFPNFTSPIPLPPPFPVSLDSHSLPLTSPLPINHPSHNEASLPLWSPLAPSPIPQVIGGAFNALLTDEDSSDDDDDGPALTPTESPTLPDEFFFNTEPPRESPGHFFATGTSGTSVLSAASPSPLKPNSKSSSETRTHSSGGRWRGGSREAEGTPRPDSLQPSSSPQGPRGSSLELSPRPHTVSPTVRNCGRCAWFSSSDFPPNTLNPNTPLPSCVYPTLLVALSSPHIPDSDAAHILLRSSDAMDQQVIGIVLV